MTEFLRFIDHKNFTEAVQSVSIGQLTDDFFSQEFFDYVENLSIHDRKTLHKSNLNLLLPITFRLIDTGLYIKQIHFFYAKRNWCTPSYVVFARKIKSSNRENVLNSDNSLLVKNMQEKVQAELITQDSKDTYEPIKVGDVKTESISSGFIGGSLDDTTAKLMKVAQDRERRKRQQKQNKD